MATYSILPVSGIYKITCTVNGKIYIGSSVNIYRRWRDHKNELRRGVHSNSHLQRAWNKYEESTFIFEVLEVCNPKTLIAREQLYLQELNPYDDRGFNIAFDAKAPMRGRKQTPEHIAKVAAANRGRKHSPEFCEMSSMANKGKPKSLEHRAKIAEANKRRKITPETRLKLSKAGKGKPHSLEHISKVALTHEKNWIVISPEGIETHIKGLNRFCREHGLNNDCMRAVANGKLKSHRDWKCRKVDV